MCLRSSRILTPHNLSPRPKNRNFGGDASPDRGSSCQTAICNLQSRRVSKWPETLPSQASHPTQLVNIESMFCSATGKLNNDKPQKRSQAEGGDGSHPVRRVENRLMTCLTFGWRFLTGEDFLASFSSPRKAEPIPESGVSEGTSGSCAVCQEFTQYYASTMPASFYSDNGTARRWNFPRSFVILATGAREKTNAVKDFEKQKHRLKWRRGGNAECVSVAK